MICTTPCTVIQGSDSGDDKTAYVALVMSIIAIILTVTSEIISRTSARAMTDEAEAIKASIEYNRNKRKAAGPEDISEEEKVMFIRYRNAMSAAVDISHRGQSRISIPLIVSAIVLILLAMVYLLADSSELQSYILLSFCLVGSILAIIIIYRRTRKSSKSQVGELLEEFDEPKNRFYNEDAFSKLFSTPSTAPKTPPAQQQDQGNMERRCWLRRSR